MQGSNRRNPSAWSVVHGAAQRRQLSWVRDSACGRGSVVGAGASGTGPLWHHALSSSGLELASVLALGSIDINVGVILSRNAIIR